MEPPLTLKTACSKRSGKQEPREHDCQHSSKQELRAWPPT